MKFLQFYRDGRPTPVSYTHLSNDWRIDENNGNQFLPGDWYSVQSDMRVSSNWQALAKNATSPFAGN